MFDDIPVEVGLVYEGERIRKDDMQIELGGPKVAEKFELVCIRPPEQVEDGKIAVIGPDIAELEPGKSHPFGILIEAAGAQLEEDLEGVLERRIHEYANYIQGFMHLNQRYDIWIRLSKRSFAKGFTSFQYLGNVLGRLFRSELPIIERIQITFYTDSNRLAPLFSLARQRYEARDARARGLTDEEVEVFYGCALCQSFAPSHICVITPQRYANCGAISWFDGRAAARIDPEGPIFTILKGECLDSEKGEYTGVNEHAKKRSMGEVERIWLYSAFGYPHTSCGCFEGIAFYIPEVEGFGIVHRGFQGVTVNGLPFSTLADSTAGGRQVEGFHGVSLEYLRSPKLLHADGGYRAIVWMPGEIKERLTGIIPAEIAPAIATESDVRDVAGLKEFLAEKKHPVVSRWAAATPVTGRTADSTAVFVPGDLAVRSGGVRVIFRNARIYAERVIIQPLQEERELKGGKRI
jgi:acetyl-CoA decarbonylase/synthase complex subunit beta